MLKKALLVIILATASQVQAQDSAPAGKPATEQRGSDKLDIKKLEQKYWAAKDDDFSVVQNRRYTKAQRFFGTVAGGVPINDPFSAGTLLGLQVGYFFNERWGLDLTYTSGNLSDNDSVKNYKTLNGAVSPNYNVFNNSVILSGTFVPLYAKMSFLDRSIIYFDMGISLGVGTTGYTIKTDDGDQVKSAFSYQIGIVQQIFFSENFAIRADFLNRFTNEEQLKYASNAPNRDLGTKLINDTAILLGLTYWH